MTALQLNPSPLQEEEANHHLKLNMKTQSWGVEISTPDSSSYSDGSDTEARRLSKKSNPKQVRGRRKRKENISPTSSSSGVTKRGRGRPRKNVPPLSSGLQNNNEQVLLPSGATAAGSNSSCSNDDWQDPISPLSVVSTDQQPQENDIILNEGFIFSPLTPLVELQASLAYSSVQDYERAVLNWEHRGINIASLLGRNKLLSAIRVLVNDDSLVAHQWVDALICQAIEKGDPRAKFARQQFTHPTPCPEASLLDIELVILKRDEQGDSCLFSLVPISSVSPSIDLGAFDEPFLPLLPTSWQIREMAHDRGQPGSHGSLYYEHGCIDFDGFLQDYFDNFDDARLLARSDQPCQPAETYSLMLHIGKQNVNLETNQIYREFDPSQECWFPLTLYESWDHMIQIGVSTLAPAILPPGIFHWDFYNNYAKPRLSLPLNNSIDNNDELVKFTSSLCLRHTAISISAMDIINIPQDHYYNPELLSILFMLKKLHNIDSSDAYVTTM